VEVIHSSEALVHIQTIRRCILEGGNFLKSPVNLWRPLTFIYAEDLPPEVYVGQVADSCSRGAWAVEKLAWWGEGFVAIAYNRA
jgi:hypothetical protein